MVFFVRITANQSHLRPICKSTKFNPKIQRTIYSINSQRLRLHILDFIRTVVNVILQRYKVLSILRESISAFYMKKETVSETGGGTCTETVSFIIGNRL